MSPAIIVNKSTGKVKLVTGAAGGSRITTTTAQVGYRFTFFDIMIFLLEKVALKMKKPAAPNYPA